MTQKELFKKNILTECVSAFCWQSIEFEIQDSTSDKDRKLLSKYWAISQAKKWHEKQIQIESNKYSPKSYKKTLYFPIFSPNIWRYFIRLVMMFFRALWLFGFFCVSFKAFYPFIIIIDVVNFFRWKIDW